MSVWPRGELGDQAFSGLGESTRHLPTTLLAAYVGKPAVAAGRWVNAG
jgi:hypothetical protein